MSTDYEKFYKENPHGLGEPFKEFVDFFDRYEKKHARILDIGCGQGRDALFIARLGHSVVGVDMSPTGIAQMVADAEKEKLDIVGVVADITDYEPEEAYDVIVIDRTLHMLPEEAERIAVLERLVARVFDSGYMLIADEKKNLPTMENFLKQHGWTITLSQKGFLFAQR